MSHYIKGQGWFDESGKKVGSQRKIDLIRARVMGSEGDIEGLTRLVIESRVSQKLLKEEYQKGKQ